jgi:purine-binding chemotaxis protein CheW
MSRADRSASRAAELRSAFDAAFARAPEPPAPPELDLLLIRVGGQRYALRLTQVLSVHTERKLVSVPSPRPDLLGLVGLRGVIAPVYDLGRLLGHASSAEPRWLAHVRAATPLAVAFESFERHVRIPQSDVTAAQGQDQAVHPFATASANSEAGPLAIIDLLAIGREVTSSTRRALTLEREGTS